ncbi:MAG: DUF115 domain-containing protein [Bacteroidota bacterium]|nr:DUF115 domain-containing protein [Bacteroidota bacterium]
MIKQLKLLRRVYRNRREHKEYLDWFYNEKNMGIPFDRRKDEDYINWFLNCRPSLFQYQNIHKGQDCFIIGNGPSLNKTNLSLLNDFYVFGLNKIHLIFDKHPLDLTYHVAANPLVIDQTKEELKNNIYNCPSFLSYEASTNIENNIKNVYKILTNAPWSFYKDITQPISEGYTVTYVAMQIAFYMGFENVYLVGMDHNFKQSGKPNEEQHHKEEDVNHFHPDYFKGHQWHLADLEGNEASYAMARHQFHANGRNIYDATIDGKLTIFPKVNFDEALKLAKKKSAL